jgi:ATP-dependent helicase/nuclease subunit B
MQPVVHVTRYGRDALERLRQVVGEAKADDPMAPVTILLPNNIAGIVARRHLAAGLPGRGPGVAGLYLSTLPRLAEQLAGATLHARRPATGAITAAAWRAALTSSAGCFAPVKAHPATVRALAAAHRTLRDLSPAAREQVRDATTLSRDLLRLHEDVCARLTDGWYDATDILHAATTLAGEQPERTTGLGTIVLYLPQSLSQAESGFARALVSNGLTAVVGMTGVERADRAVRRTLGRLGITEVGPTPKPALATRVLHASDADDEVRCVVRDVVATLATGTPAHRVAILYGAARPYARLLHEHLAASGVVTNGPATRAVQERAIARGFLGVLELWEAGLPRSSTFTALAEAPTRDLAGDNVKVARWERVSRAAGVVGDTDWQVRLDHYAATQQEAIDEQEQAEDPQPARLDAARRELETTQALAGFINRLRQRLEDGAARKTWPDLSAWSLDLFHDLYGEPGELVRLPAEEQYAAAVIEGVLRGLAGLSTFESEADLASLVDILALELESALPRVGRFAEGVFVGPVSAAVGMDLDAVFVLGLAEDGFPGRLHEDALLSETFREAASGELDLLRDRLDAKHRHLLAAFAAAPEVTASFPRGDLRRSTERLPSRFLLHTLRTITGNDSLMATEWAKASAYKRDVTSELIGSESFAETIRQTDQPATEQEWRVRAASAGADAEDGTVLAARVLLRARASSDLTRFDGNLGAVAGLPDYADGTQVVSPTALETFAACPHRFFSQRLLRVEPLEDPAEIVKVSAADIGTLMHAVMDRLISESQTAGTLPSYAQPWSAEHGRRMREIALEEAEDLTARGLTGHPRIWESELTQILVDLDRMLADDNKWRAEHDAEVLASELTFGMKNDDGPIQIEVDAGTVRMRGSADKVDRARGGRLLVTDIKSGRGDKFRAIKGDPVAAGTKLQLPVYAHAARREFGGEHVQAQYWFVRKPDAGKRISVDLDPALEQRYAETLSVLVSSIRQGLFVHKPSEKPAWNYVDCPYCTPDGLGHDEARRRYEHKRGAAELTELIALIDPEEES